METNPFMRTSISDLVHVRNEAYKGLALEVDLVEERLIEVETIVTSLGSGMNDSVARCKKFKQTKTCSILNLIEILRYPPFQIRVEFVSNS